MNARSYLKAVARQRVAHEHARKNATFWFTAFTHINKGKVYPYNSTKRGWRKPMQEAA